MQTLEKQSLEKFLTKFSIWHIFLLALIIRIALLPLSFNGDLNNHYIWGRFAYDFGIRGFYDWLNFGYYARPDYPPLAILLFWLIHIVSLKLFDFAWLLNITFPFFPSSVITFWEPTSDLFLLKIPSFLSDFGLGYLIYRYVKLRWDTAKAKLAAILFLFNPPIIYLSTSWGQLEPYTGFFFLLSLLLLLEKKYIISLLAFLTSVLTKPTMLVATPLLAIIFFRSKPSLPKISLLVAIALAYLYLIAYPFTPIENFPLLWLYNIYPEKFLTGPPTLTYITVNAFNFWCLIFGMQYISDRAVYFGFTLQQIAWSLTLLLLIPILYKFWKTKDQFFALSLMFFTVFMFLSRVHERYLYPLFIFFPIVLIKFPKYFKIFIILSLIFWINLYHWWWFPEIGPLKTFLSIDAVERLLSLIYLGCFIYLYRDFLKAKH